MKKLIFIQEKAKRIKVYTSKFELIGYIKFNKKLNLWTWENTTHKFLTLTRLNEVASYIKRLQKEQNKK